MDSISLGNGISAEERTVPRSISGSMFADKLLYALAKSKVIDVALVGTLPKRSGAALVESEHGASSILITCTGLLCCESDVTTSTSPENLCFQRVLHVYSKDFSRFSM